MNDSSGEALLYLGDFGYLLKQAAFAAKAKRDAAEESSRSFENGRLLAYYEIVSLMQQQAVAFGIPLNELGLEGVEPDRDLL